MQKLQIPAGFADSEEKWWSFPNVMVDTIMMGFLAAVFTQHEKTGELILLGEPSAHWSQTNMSRYGHKLLTCVLLIQFILATTATGLFHGCRLGGSLPSSCESGSFCGDSQQHGLSAACRDNSCDAECIVCRFLSQRSIASPLAAPPNGTTLQQKTCCLTSDDAARDPTKLHRPRGPPVLI